MQPREPHPYHAVRGRRLALSVATSLALASCASVLGDDYSFPGNTAAVNAGTGGQGGASGSGGGSGAGGAGSGGAAGTSDAGSGGATGGGAGIGGSGPVGPAYGEPCEFDADCRDGLRCFGSGQSDWLIGGPAHGYCSRDCTDELLDAKKNDPAVTTIACAGGGVCAPIHFSDDAARCFAPCTFGTPLPGPVYPPPLPGEKCHGRPDLACGVVAMKPTGEPGATVCVPQCGSDADCPQGRRCDTTIGVCYGSGLAPSNATLGQACESSDATCAGFCMEINQPTAPNGWTGVCASYCTVGAPLACGGPDKGICGWELFSPSKPGTPAGYYDPVLPAPGDRALCLPVTTKGDAGCTTLAGYYSFTFPGAGGVTACMEAVPCTTSKDCGVRCSTGAICPEGDSCVDFACQLPEGKTDSVAWSCLPIPGTGESYCLDHAP